MIWPSKQQIIKSMKYALLGALPGIIWFAIAGSAQSVIVGCLVLFVAVAFSFPEVSVERVLEQTALSFIPAPIRLASELMNKNKEEKEPSSEIFKNGNNTNGVGDPRETPEYKILFAYFAKQMKVFPDPENIIVGCLFQNINADLLLTNLIFNNQGAMIEHLFKLTDQALEKEGSPEKALDVLAPNLEPEYEKKLVELQTKFHELVRSRLIIRLQFNLPPLVSLVLLARIGVFRGTTGTSLWTIIWEIQGDKDPFIIYIDYLNGEVKNEVHFLITPTEVQQIPVSKAKKFNGDLSAD